MAEVAMDLNKQFAHHHASLPPDVMGELESILRIHSISPQELFYKWESYSMKMGGEDVKMDLKNARELKKDIQDALERDMRTKSQTRGSERKTIGATPRATTKAGADVFGMLEGIVPDTPRLPMRGVNGNSAKRRSDFQTPASKVSKLHAGSSPSDRAALSAGVLGQAVPFPDRQGAGQIVESLNQHIDLPSTSTTAAEPRIKLKANTDLTKFTYKPMAMKLSEASEILDDRIESFIELVQAHHSLEDGTFGNPANQSANEIVAVGRIASDSSEGKLNTASVVLETSRRTGAGLRVPIKLDAVSGYELFPGKIVALRGSNPTGEQFVASEILALPLLPPSASTVSELDMIRARLAGTTPDALSGSDTTQPLNVMISSGPYTANNNLDFEPLHELCSRAAETHADALILLGPFLDIEHPLILSGDLPELPASLNISSDQATMTDVFRGLIALPLQQITQQLPSITIIMVPSVRDTINKHISWPQDRMARRELGLPKQCAFVSNPVTISLNETVVGISTQDILYELQQEKCTGPNLPPAENNLLARLSKHVIEQRHFFPLFPPTARENLPKPTTSEFSAQKEANESAKATGAMLDISYSALGEWQHVRPDVLIMPSALAPFAKVVESVVVINPGCLSKKRGAGTYVRMTVKEAEVGEEQRRSGEVVANKLFERTRVDVVRI